MYLKIIPDSKTIFSFIFSLLPLSFIIGNTAINLNLACLVIFYFIFKKKIKPTKIELIDKIIIFYFTYIFIVLVFNLIENHFFQIHENYINLMEGNFVFWKNINFKNINIYLTIKSVSYLRFLLLYFIVKSLIENDLIDVKLFFISCSIFCLLVSFDIFYQYFFKVDIFGIKPIHPRKLSGPFGEELIAGSYIQKFSLFLLFTPLIFFSDKKNLILFPLLILFIFLSILISGNRLPLIMFLLSIVILTFFNKKILKFFLIFLIITILPTYFFFKSNINIKNNYLNFKTQLVQIYNNTLNQNKIENKTSHITYYDEFASFYKTWQMNKYLGGGLRSFRINCPKREGAELTERLFCNTHPHNYYLEILTDLGLVGFLIFCLLIIYMFFIFYKNYKVNKFYLNNYTLPLSCALLIEIFPIRSTGSFFTNSNATYMFLLISIILGLIKKTNNQSLN